MCCQMRVDWWEGSGAGEAKREVTAGTSDRCVFARVRQLVIVVSVGMKNLVHRELESRPDLLAF